MTSNPPRVLSPRPRTANASAILALLGQGLPAWGEVALVAARDPVLCLALLSASPLAGGKGLEDGLNSALQTRLETLGADLLRAWLCHTESASGRADAAVLLTAECALHLALETRYPRPDEAYLAGLWLTPSTFCLPAQAADADVPLLPADQAAARHVLHAAIAEAAGRCGLSAAVRDVLEAGQLLDEQAARAHPLLRIVHAARLLASESWPRHLPAIEALTRLDSAALRSLRTDVGYIVAGHAAYPPAAVRPEGQALPVIVAADPADAFHAAALRGLILAAFAELDESAVAPRAALASRLLAGRDLPLVALAGEDGCFQAVLGPDLTRTAFNELALAEDDPASCIALAARSGRAAAFADNAQGPARSVADWQVARWLGGRGFDCLPLAVGGRFGVAMVAVEPDADGAASTRWLLTELLGAASRRLREHHAAREASAAREAALRGRFHAHARRIAHEAANPLTVIRTRLDMLGQQQAAGSALHGEVALLNTELDRVARLLRGAGELPADETELARCNLTELLLEMRTMYADTLFTAKGITFELRAASGVPPVAIPPSALRQVLLNLFRNAAEALQPGGRLAVALAGQANANGRSCAEIRLVDNGPGLPEDRLADLFAPRPSTKGGSHQGVGLSVVRDILAQWNASILCRSQSGGGTSFQIFVPLEQRP